MIHLLSNLIWIYFDLGCSTIFPSYPASSAKFTHQPKQNPAEGGTAKIKVNPTQVRQEMCHPVQRWNHVPKVITSKLTGTATEEDATEWEEKLTNSGNTFVARTMTTSDMAGV